MGKNRTGEHPCGERKHVQRTWIAVNNVLNSFDLARSDVTPFAGDVCPLDLDRSSILTAEDARDKIKAIKGRDSMGA